MDGIEFEYYLEALFSKLNYKPNVTKASNDYGADLILKNENKK
ncbi:restriction endonuclease [Staphylococcus aureus]|nr:restriction endonuclease [Staphylococcus aureus]MDT3909583.1 restriction endonuclease [Staphylococcus aureus]